MEFANVQLLETVERETGAEPTACVIWLHGLGADGNDFVPLIPELGLSALPGVRFVFPHAPVRSVTINNGMRMRAWYDIVGVDLNHRADVAGVQQSRKEVEDLIEREKSRGMPASSIVLAGFSQGGVIALDTGLRHTERLAGIMALSTYVVQPEKLSVEIAAVNRDVPIFMGHGTADPVVRYEWGDASRRALVQNGCQVEWHSYRMEHSLCLEEIRDIAGWLARVLRKK
jgi:phospholipase/carboxylesterase